MPKVTKILCPVELWGDEANSIVDYAAMAAKAFGASLILMHVAPKFDTYATASEVFVHAGKITDDIVKRSYVKMEELLASPSLKEIKATSLIIPGKADEEILKAIQKEKVDMLVIGTHGKNAISRTFFGSVAEKIVRTSPVPVLTVRPE